MNGSFTQQDFISAKQAASESISKLMRVRDTMLRQTLQNNRTALEEALKQPHEKEVLLPLVENITALEKSLKESQHDVIGVTQRMAELTLELLSDKAQDHPLGAAEVVEFLVARLEKSLGSTDQSERRNGHSSDPKVEAVFHQQFEARRADIRVAVEAVAESLGVAEQFRLVNQEHYRTALAHMQGGPQP